jgi:hypothetical protein
MPPKKQVIDLPVVGVIDLNDEAPMKTKKPKKVKEVMEAVVEMPVVEVVQDKPKKARKVKTPVAEVMPELELNRNYDEPVKEDKPKVGKNPWIEHIKQFSIDNGLTYNKSMIHPDLKKNYVKTTNGKVTL